MADILNAKMVLRLNALYQRIGWSTVADTFVAMCSGTDKTPPALALDIEYELGPDGKPDLTKMASAVPVSWEEWIKLPIREWDMSVKTVKMTIRVPTVIICPKFHNMPIKELRPTKQAIRTRDGNKCQYTGQVLTNKTASIDHILPKSRGGRDSWKNLVACHRDVNSKKGNKLNEELGLKLLKQPFEPRPIPMCQLITDVKHPDHQHF
jgi:hypothetical protein